MLDGGGIAARAWSISASVVDQPSDRRSDPAARSAGTPMAASTWEASMAPLEHDDAAEA